MEPETGWQRIAGRAVAAFFIVAVLALLTNVLTSLNDAEQSALARYVDKHASVIGGFLAGLLPAVGTYVFGRREGKTEAYNSAIATTENQGSGDQAAGVLRREALAHKIKVRV